jgi:hypothetical protein
LRGSVKIPNVHEPQTPEDEDNACTDSFDELDWPDDATARMIEEEPW